MSEDFKIGKNVAIIWKKQDNSAYGGTDGVVLGVVGDEIAGKYLIIDRSTYQDSFKSMLPFLNILDLRVIPLKDVNLFTEMDVRKRPPGTSENSKMSIEVDYKSNIDFNETILEIEKRSDCKHKRIGNLNAELYQFNVNNIQSIKHGSIQITNTGSIQFYCGHMDLDVLIDWFKESAKLPSGQNCLVLVPTKVTYQIHSTFKEPSKPTDELVHRLGKLQRTQPLVFPIGWIQKFFSELDKNPLQELFPNAQNIYDVTLETTNGKKKEIPSSEKTNGSISSSFFDSHYLTSGVNINKYLGAIAPIMRLEGLLLDPKDENELVQRWIDSRRDLWNWFTYKDFEGKINMRDLTIDKKSSTYTLDFRKYYGTDFFLTKAKSESAP